MKLSARRLLLVGVAFTALFSPAVAVGQPPKSAEHVVMRFYGFVTDDSVAKLLTAVDQKVRAGAKRITLLISSPGGSVFAGLSAYAYLKGVPAEVVTHNFGEVDSIAAVIYCAGAKRYSVPQGRFLLHSVASHFQQGVPFSEGQVEQQLKIMRQQQDAIAAVLAATAKKSVQDVRAAIAQNTVLGADEAMRWGLVQDIKAELYEPGADVLNIASSETNPDQVARHTTNSLAVFTVPQRIFTVPMSLDRPR